MMEGEDIDTLIRPSIVIMLLPALVGLITAIAYFYWIRADYGTGQTDFEFHLFGGVFAAVIYIYIFMGIIWCVGRFFPLGTGASIGLPYVGATLIFLVGTLIPRSGPHVVRFSGLDVVCLPGAFIMFMVESLPHRVITKSEIKSDSITDSRLVDLARESVQKTINWSTLEKPTIERFSEIVVVSFGKRPAPNTRESEDVYDVRVEFSLKTQKVIRVISEIEGKRGVFQFE